MFYEQLAFLFLYYGNMENLNAIIMHFQANLVARCEKCYFIMRYFWKKTWLPTTFFLIPVTLVQFSISRRRANFVAWEENVLI